MSSSDNNIDSKSKPASSDDDNDSLRMMAFGGSEKGDETDSVKDMNEMLNTNYHRGGSISSNDRLEGEDILIYSQSAEVPILMDPKSESNESNHTPKASNAARDVDPHLSNNMPQQLSQPHGTVIPSEQQNLDGSRTRSDSVVMQHPGNDQPSEQIRGRFRIQPSTMAQSPLLSRDPSRSRSPPTRLPVHTAPPSAISMSPHTGPKQIGVNTESVPQTIQPTGQTNDAEVKLPATQRYPPHQPQQPLSMVGTPQQGRVTPVPLMQQQIPGQNMNQMAKQIEPAALQQNIPQAMVQQEATINQMPSVPKDKQEVLSSDSVVGDGSLASYPPPSIPPLVYPSQPPVSSSSTSVQPTVVGMVGKTPIVAIPEKSLPQTFSKKKGRFKLLPATTVQTPGTPTGTQQPIERTVPERSVSLGAVPQAIPLQTVDGALIIKKKGRFVVTNVSPNIPTQTVITTAQPILPIDPKMTGLQAPTRSGAYTAHAVVPSNQTNEMQAPVPVPVTTQPILTAENTATSTPSAPIANSMAQQPVLPAEKQPTAQTPVFVQTQVDQTITAQSFQTNAAKMPSSPIVIAQAPNVAVVPLSENSSLSISQQPALGAQRTSPVPATLGKHVSEPNSPSSFQPYGGRPPAAFTSAPPEELVKLKAGTGEKAKVPSQQQRPTKAAARHIAPGFGGQQQGFGKIYYFLDQMRSEVQEADRTIKSLQTDMKCMKEKNKELEAKAREMERKYNQEKALREVAETRLKAMKKKYRMLKGGSNDAGGQKEDDSLASNQTGGRHSRANSLDGGMELPYIASSSGNVSVANSESSKTASNEFVVQVSMHASSRNATPEKKTAQINASKDEAIKPKTLIVERSFNQDELAKNVQQTLSNFDDGATTRAKPFSHEQSSTSPHRDASIWQISGGHSSGQKPPAIPPVLPSKSNNHMTQTIKSGANLGSSKNTPGSSVRQMSATVSGSQNDSFRTYIDHQLSGNNPSVSSVSCSSNESPDAIQPNQLGVHSRNDSGCSVHSAVRPPNSSNFDPLATPNQQNVFEANALFTEIEAPGLHFNSRLLQNQQPNMTNAVADSTANANESSTLLNLRNDSSTSPNLPVGQRQNIYPQHQIQMQIATIGDGVSFDKLQQPQLTYQQPVPAKGSQHQQQQHQQWISHQQPDLLSSSQDDLNSLLSSMNVSQQATDPFDELVQTRQSSQGQNPH